MTTNPVVTVTDELLEELEQLAGKATPGPWEFAEREQYDYGSYWLIQTKAEKDGWELAEIRMDVPYNEGNAAFMACANPATILALLNHIRTMQQELKAAHISVDNCELFRRDAERMAWLISQGDSMQWMNIIKVDPDEFETLDSAIDAAMTASHSS